MSNAKHTPKRKRRVKAVPVLGAAGLLSLAGGASAATRVGSGPADAKDRAESRNHKKRTNTATGSSGPSRPYWSADRRNGAPNSTGGSSMLTLPRPRSLANCELSLGCPPDPGRGSWSCGNDTARERAKVQIHRH
jgi:hypothetical protein